MSSSAADRDQMVRSSLRRIAVLGLGKVGLLAARLLHDQGFEVVGIDQRENHQELPFQVIEGVAVQTPELRSHLEAVDGVLSCLPFDLNSGIATIAHELGLHYFDLTEDVPTTEKIRELATSSVGLMAPQCGLAPGFVGIVAARQANSFDRCRSIKMRVGALPQHPTGLLGYAFNWSPEGVVNEYLNDCEVIESGERKWVSPMEWHETVYVAGTRLEAFTTSGGLGTMCETYHGKVENLDYKTLRYPGHMRQMNFFFHELLMRERRELAGEILTNAKPPVDEDVVYIHVASEGDVDGQLKRIEYVRSFLPRDVGAVRATAIAWTTAASVVGVIEMVSTGKLPSSGFLKQEEINFQDFLKTATGSFFAEGGSTNRLPEN